MDPWRYQPAEDIGLSPAERLVRFPRSPDLSVYVLRTIAAAFLRTWLRVYHRFEVHGREHLPRAGSFVMVANHSSHLDALCLLSALPMRLIHHAFPAAARDYFFESLLHAAVAAIVCNALPFGRKANVRQSLELCAGLLRGPGNVLILFPEGTRSQDGAIGAFRPGIGALLAGTTVPVVPCALLGTARAWPKGRRLPRPRKVSLRIGEPRDFARTRRGGSRRSSSRPSCATQCARCGRRGDRRPRAGRAVGLRGRARVRADLLPALARRRRPRPARVPPRA